MSKSSKRIVALVLTLMMAFSLIAVPVSADQATTKADAQQYLVRDDVQLIQGDENGNPQWAAQLSRQDMVVILSRFAGEEEVAASYDTTNMTFTDIADPYYAPFVAWAQDLGITEGYSPEQFGFGDKLTAWQTKAFFLRALGYFPTDDEVNAMADQYGITVGSNVADDVQIARGDMAVMMFNTLFAENANGSTIQEERGLPTVTAEENVVLSNVAASATTTSDATVTITGKVTPVDATVTVAGKATTVATDGAFSAVVDVNKAAANGVNTYAVKAVKGTKEAAQNVTVTYVAPAALAVVSATAADYKEVKLAFNNEVSTDTTGTGAGNTANYSIAKKSDNSTVGVAAVVVDGKNVTVVAATPFTAADYTVVVKNVASKDGKLSIDATNGVAKDFTVAMDVNVPQFTGVTVTGNKVLKVNFSEPVANLDAVTAALGHNFNFAISADNGTTYNSLTDAQVAITPDADLKAATITFASALAAGNYKLQLSTGGANDVVDYAGYKAPKLTQDFVVAVPTTVAQATGVTVSSRTEVVANFSAAVVLPANTTLYWNTDGLEASDAHKADVTVTKLTDSSYKFTFITAANIIPTGNVTFYVKGVTDAFGNAVPTNHFAVTVNQDAVATATVTVKDDKNIEVTFSKPMQNDASTNGANNANYYVIKDKDGKNVSVTANYTEANSVYKTVLTSGTSLSGSYTITVSDIKDAVGQIMTAVTNKALTITDTTKPLVGSIDVNGNATTKQIVVTFPEAMSVSGVNSIANINNYSYAPAGTTFDVLPSGTTLVAAADAKSVTITLPATATVDTVAPNQSILQIGAVAASTIYTVADAAGNIQDVLPGAGTQIAVAPDSAPSIAAGVTTIAGANQIKVKVSSTANFASVSAADFTYTIDNGATAYKAAAGASLTTDSDGNQYVLITTSSDDTMKASTLKTDVKVKTVAAPAVTTSKSALGTIVANGETSSAGSDTVFAASIKSIEIQDANTIILALDGKVNSVASLGSQFVVYQNGSKVNAIITATKVGEFPTSVVALGLDNAIDPTVKVTVKTVSQDFMSNVDANGKVLTANTNGLDGVATLVAKTLVTDGTVPGDVTDGDTFVVTFNRAINKDSVKAAWDGSSATATVRVSTDGKLTVDGYNFGDIEGFGTVAAASFATSTIAYDAAAKTLTITIGGVGVQTLAYPAAHGLSYVPASVTSSEGLAVSTTVKPQN